MDVIPEEPMTKKDDKKGTTRDWGMTLTHPDIKTDINRRIYEIFLRENPQKARRFWEYRKAFDRAADLEVELDFPIHLIVEVMYACNYRCPQCLLGISELKKKFGGQGMMTMEQFKRIVDEAERYQTPSMLLNGVNEPLLDDHLIERMQYARDHGFIDIHLHTNGELMTEEFCHQLIDSGCTRFMISLDAFSAETFSKIRVGGNYDQVLKNIDMFLDIRRQRQAELPIFRVSMVRQKLNEHEIQPFVDYWVPRSDYVYLQTYQEVVDTRGFNYYQQAEDEIPKDFRCEQPWYAMYIRPKGDALPCCSFMGYYLKMGNVFENSMHEVWHADPYREMRALHQRGEFYLNDACNKCVTGMFAVAEKSSEPSL
jgi:radical SAM protein with 4Fe4S-binding SPASM domain